MSVEEQPIDSSKINQQAMAAEKKIMSEMQLIVKFRSTMVKDVGNRLQGIPGATPPRIVNVILQILRTQHTDLVQFIHSYCRQPVSSDQWVPVMADHELKIIELLKHLDSSMNGISELFLSQGTELLYKSKGDTSMSVIALSGICRVVSGILRQKGLPIQAKMLAYNLIHQKAPGCPTLILALASVWPHAIFKANNKDDPVLKVIEYIVMKDMLHTKSHHVKISQCLKSLANWTVQDTDSTKLTRFLLEGLEMSIRAQLPQDIITNICKALELLSGYEAWSWVNDTFIIEILWPELKAYVESPLNSKIPTQLIQSLLKILGIATSRCPIECRDATGMVMKTLNVFIIGSHCNNVPLSVQQSALEALLRLAPFSPLLAIATCQQWLQSHQDEASPDVKDTIATFLESYKSTVSFAK